MQQRLQAYVTDRTQMLGAIAHDLRTPLTRLAFRMEALNEGDRAKLQADVAEMEAMVQSTLGLARADSQPVERQRLELGSLVEKAAEDLAVTGRKVSAEAQDTLVVDGDPVGLRRLFTNLLDNGETYGKSAHAHAWREGAYAIVDVLDEGPGLPPGEEERVFEPFYRLERSRSRGTGGTGLGLPVARSIARLHGGDVVLTNRPGGGLRARVTIPIAR
jgi:signal transduction histidine kinase